MKDSAPAATPPADMAFRILYFTCIGHTVTHVFLALFTPILRSMAHDCSIPYEQAGFYLGLCNFFFGLGAVPAGWLSDRHGEKALLVIFFLGCALGGIFIGAATNPFLLAAGVVTLGTATSIYHPVGNAMISKYVARRGGRAMGINGIAGSAGTALGPVIAGLAADYTGSWRWAFIGPAVPSVYFAFRLWRERFAPAPASAGAPPAAGAARAGAGPPGAAVPIRIWIFFFLILGAMTLSGFYFNMIITVLPEHLSGTALMSGKSLSAGAIKTGFSLIFGAAGQYIAGSLSDRWSPRVLYIINLIAVFPLILAVGHASGPILLATSCCASFFIFSSQPIENTILANFGPVRWRGAIYGAKFILAFSLGGGSGSWAAPWIASHYGLPRVFEAAAAAALVAACCAISAAWITRKIRLP